MSYFPLFIELSQKTCLVVGGGKVAYRKVQKLLPYGPQIVVTAPKISAPLRALKGPVFYERAFRETDLAGCTLVIAATADKALNHTISGLCRQKSIPVNVVDDKEACTFLFPALVKRGPLSVGISTGGASPAAAVSVKELLDSQLSQQLGPILESLSQKREAVKAVIPEEPQRAALFEVLYRASIKKGKPLTEAEFQDLLHRAEESHGS
ncbi:MAG: bifunctional precorrin-2 dehydrogenase/sirohydrochlorin ferrochelatase [Oscillospiraceae bacterium]|jgi:precorrin-2 dehydrogenase/sirohydrochlorin ferrochelatase|nr:bifunctional precorrin-2 dehydrogenase/sirohydrochlorin ferrochelatase [Oscillospiraceae bacterium]MDD3260610.1 bifunctional precorrin-2 dehydrogenase/sirohydrochlorin ferrochelatase [Oscillospiraceae bacterium]